MKSGRTAQPRVADDQICNFYQMTGTRLQVAAYGDDCVGYAPHAI
jgi:hypothetical protein